MPGTHYDRHVLRAIHAIGREATGDGICQVVQQTLGSRNSRIPMGVSNSLDSLVELGLVYAEMSVEPVEFVLTETGRAALHASR